MGNLFIVATPIGNLQDITVRAIKVLLDCEIVACEDTRKTGILLNKIREYYSKLFLNEKKTGNPKLLSYFEQNEKVRIPQIISLLKKGLNIALVSDSGTPAISDPGFKLIRECIKENVKVESIPGPSSVISSLVVSGLPTDKFLFAGFPPKKEGNRIRYFNKLKKTKEELKQTIVIFEAPYRLLKTLSEIINIFGNTDAVIVREMTKVFEEIKRDRLSELMLYFEKKKPKGEFVILL